MRIAFYAPLKPPDHPVPSGDRRVAQLLRLALSRAGHEVELAARLRSYDGGGDTERQHRLAELGGRLAARLIEQLGARTPARRPRAWLTYHLYHKAPDWIGPRVAARLGIPYVVVEASVAAKRAGGPWSLGHEATLAALKRADAVISLNPADDDGVIPHLRDAARLRHLKPFLESAAFATAAQGRADQRREIAGRFHLPSDEPWLVAVAMMRAGDKLASYRVLGAALDVLRARPWRLLTIGDGPARREVEAALAPVRDRVVHVGAVDPGRLPGLLAAADLLVWPAINEAYGMAILEAQAAGLPAVAGRSGGVPELIVHERTGLLTPPGDAAAFAAAVDTLLAAPERRLDYGAAAMAKVAAEHDVVSAGAALDRILQAVAAERA